jgi:hypothetical protein
MKLPPIKQLFYRHPVALGLGITGTLLLGLLIQTIVLDRFPVIFGPEGSLGDFRIAVVHFLLAGYFPCAYLYLLRGTRNTVHELDKVLEPADDASDLGSAAHIGVKALFVAGLIGVLLALFFALLTVEALWDPSAWTPEAWWHRVLGPFIGLWFGWIVLAILFTSTRISRLADRIGSVDLLDLSPWSPFVNQGLLTALLIVGAVSIVSLFLLDPEQRRWLVVAITVGLCLPLALLGLLLPVRGLRRRIRTAKGAELAWIRDSIRQSRTHLRDGSSDASPGQMADLTAYQRLIKDVPEWPFRTSTLVQVLLYLLIPVASWIGGLLIENGLGYLFG